MEFAALNGFSRRELRLFFRLNDIRLRNWRKSKLRIVSMVDGLNKWHINNWWIMSATEREKKKTRIHLKSIIFEKLFRMMLTNRHDFHTDDGCCYEWDVAWLLVMICYELQAFDRLYVRAHPMNCFAMVIFWWTTYERIVIDLGAAWRDVDEFQSHRCYIHPLEMVYHRLNAVIHIRLVCVCNH